jgi:hypothetical protein
MIKEVMVLEEVSLVDQPVQPEARLTSIPISITKLRKALGPDFEEGNPIACNKCLSGCWGFTTLSKVHDQRSSSDANEFANGTE